MIVVIGSPVLRRDPATTAVDVVGLPGRIAMAAASANRTVQLVGKVGDDDAGDTLLNALTTAGVGHAATLRDASNATPTSDAPPAAADDDPFPADDFVDALPLGLPLEAGDVQLALRYLTEFRVVVIAAPLDAQTLATAIESAGFAGAHVIRLDGGTDDVPTDIAMTAFEAPADDEPAFAAMVGQYAAGLDGGRTAADAFTDATRGTNWERARAD